MKDVYSNAEICIAATSAPDADTGLFFRREPALLLPFPVSLGFLESSSIPESPKQDQYLCALWPYTISAPGFNFQAWRW